MYTDVGIEATACANSASSIRYDIIQSNCHTKKQLSLFRCTASIHTVTHRHTTQKISRTVAVVS